MARFQEATKDPPLTPQASHWLPWSPALPRSCKARDAVSPGNRPFFCRTRETCRGLRQGRRRGRLRGIGGKEQQTKSGGIHGMNTASPGKLSRPTASLASGHRSYPIRRCTAKFNSMLRSARWKYSARPRFAKRFALLRSADHGHDAFQPSRCRRPHPLGLDIRAGCPVQSKRPP